jgi:hypothetical protein
MYEKRRRTVTFAKIVCYFPDLDCRLVVASQAKRTSRCSNGVAEAFQGVRLDGDLGGQFLPLSSNPRSENLQNPIKA